MSRNTHEDAIARLERALAADRAAVNRAFQSFRRNISVGNVVAEGSDIAKSALAEGRAKARDLLHDGSEVAKSALEQGKDKAQSLLGTLEGPAQEAKAKVWETAQGAKSTVRAHPLLTAGAGVALGSLLLWQLLPKREAAARQEDWLEEADALRTRAAKLIAQVDEAIEAGSADLDELEAHREDILDSLTTSVRSALAKGLEDLDPEEADEILQARERRYLGAMVDAHQPKGASSSDAQGSSYLTPALVMVAAGVAVALLAPRLKLPEGQLRDMAMQLFGEVSKVASGEAQRAGDFSHQLVETVMQALTRRS